MHNFFDQSFIAALLLFAGMLLIDYFGLRVKIKIGKADADARDGLGPIEETRISTEYLFAVLH